MQRHAERPVKRPTLKVPERERIRLTLPVKLPSPNTWANKHRAWQRVAWLKARFLRELPPLAKHRRPVGPVRLTVTRVLGPRERLYDTDNAYAAVKPLLDALKVAGYIVDDTPAMLDLAVRQDDRVRPARPEILISIRSRA